MIVIFSEEQDNSTNEVIDWIKFHKKDFVRINPSDEITQFKIDENFNFTFQIGLKKINLEDIKSFWYRRGYFNIKNHPIEEKEFKYFNEFEEHKYKERKVTHDFILKKLNNISLKVGNFFDNNINKINVLNLASKIGINIPPTIITNKKSDLQEFIDKHKNIITKPLSNVIFKNDGKLQLVTYTSRITPAVLSEIPSNFHLSLFQKEIDKKYELRIFYLMGKFYSMAIFSQTDEQTSVDFRNYNKEVPNRNVPFTLPKEIEEKLHLLMKELKIESSSIDMIVSKTNDFYFLEINPVGQFGMVSNPCNYNLEKEIAEVLCKEQIL